VGSTDVDFLIPEYWRIFRPTEDLNPSDRSLIAALSRPGGMLERMQQSLGPYLMGNDVSLEADETKTRFAIDILVKKKPRFMTLHLGSLDYQEHEHGPFSAAAKPGYYTGGNLSGPAVTDFAGHGGHGFAPHHPDMRAALFIAGSGIARHRDLGQIDMRQVAPTVAALLGVKLPAASAAPLLVRQ
jgi:hypothetical protein